jgi:hypothetical protein
LRFPFRAPTSHLAQNAMSYIHNYSGDRRAELSCQVRGWVSVFLTLSVRPLPWWSAAIPRYAINRSVVKNETGKTINNR